MRAKIAIAFLSALLISYEAISAEADAKNSSDKINSTPKEVRSNSGVPEPQENKTSDYKVDTLSEIYNQLGYSSHRKLAEIAVKHDLDKELLVQKNAKKTTLDLSSTWLNRVEIDGDRIRPKKDFDFPYQIKCSEYDKRILNLCIRAEYFKPKISAYYDKGKDKAGKVDLFENGSAVVSVDLISVYVPWRFGYSEYFDSWYWGPTIGLGLSSSSTQAKTKTEPGVNGDSSASSNDSSPVALFSFGFRSAYAPNGAEGFSFGVEVGGVRGYSTNENFGDKTDKAAYLGFSLNVPLSGKTTP